MQKKPICICLLFAALLAALTACGAGKPAALTAGDVTEQNLAQVCEVLSGAGLSNVDVFEQWVHSSLSGASDDGSSGFSDADCRMTVMLLAGDRIAYDSVEETYDGDYLMFDVDAIENNAEYSVLRDKERLFTTMFGEMPIPESGFADALSETWNKHGIRVDSDRFSVISILFKAYGQEEAFVGHTGILIDCRDNDSVGSDYLFLEKIAFGDPFRITPVDDEQALLKVFSERPDYSVEDGAPAPVVCRNAERIGELTP